MENNNNQENKPDKEKLLLIDFVNLICYFIIYFITIRMDHIPQLWLWPAMLTLTMLLWQGKRNFLTWLEMILVVFILVFNSYVPNGYIFLALSILMLLRYLIYIKHSL